MSEERKKVLEMLSEGKISVDEAERLLKALGEAAPAPPPPPPPPEPPPKPEDANGIDLDDLEQNIRNGVRMAREQVRASMPRLRNVIRDTAPDVERIVQEATASIPSIVEEMTRSIRDAFGQPSQDSGNDDRFTERVDREFTEQAALGDATQLELHNPCGGIEVETWDEERVLAQVTARVRSTDEETARECAEAVSLAVEPAGERLVLRPVFAGGRDRARYELDVRLQLPARLRLDLHTRHGNLTVPEMAADVVLGGEHGQLQLAGTAGAAKIQHDHGKVHIGRVAGDVVLNTHHSHLDLDEAVGPTKVNSHHGRLRIRRIGGQLVLNAHHAPLTIDEVHGDTVANNHHGPISIQRVLQSLTVNSHHSPVDVGDIGGRLQVSTSHGPVRIGRVAGEVSARCSHAPIDIGAIGGSAVVRGSHSPVRLGPVEQEVTVEADRGEVHIAAVGGRCTVRADRAQVAVHKPAGEVLIENNRAAIAVVPESPVSAAYTLSNSRGNVKVVLPEGSDVEVHGFVRRGRVDTDMPLAVSANGEQGQSVDGRIGQGGPAVRAEVERGNLSLVHA